MVERYVIEVMGRGSAMVTFLWVVFGGAFFVVVTWAWYRLGRDSVVKCYEKDMGEKNCGKTRVSQPQCASSCKRGLIQYASNCIVER